MTDEVVGVSAVQIVELESLMGSMQGESPVGPDLEYDGEYMALAVAMAGQGLRMVEGDDDAEKGRDWRALFTQARALAERTRDLRVDARLARCALGRHGVIGLAAGLTLVRSHIEMFWDVVHPIPDEEDGFDITERYNALSGIGDPGLIQALSLSPLFEALGAQSPSLSTFEIASGKRDTIDEEVRANAVEIVARLGDAVGADKLVETSKVIQTALDDLKAIQELWRSGVASLDAKAGEAGMSFAGAGVVQFESLEAALRDILRYIGQALPEEEFQVFEATAKSGGAVVGAVSGVIGSRTDAVVAITRIIDWFERNEPSSPVPALLERARSMVNKSFLQIIDELGEGGIAEARKTREAPQSFEE